MWSYQSTLISRTSFFSQWYFPSSEPGINENLREIVAISPFLHPSLLYCLLPYTLFMWLNFARPNGEPAHRLTKVIFNCHYNEKANFDAVHSM